MTGAGSQGDSGSAPAGKPAGSGAEAIKRILQAWKDNDYFKLLGLPQPGVDELDRPTWECSSGDVSRAYRRLSVQVHPDKHGGCEEARRAFEALNAAHRSLTDQGQLEEALRSKVGEARAKRDAEEAGATLGERVVLNAQKAEKARELRKEEGKSFQNEIVRQIRQKQFTARRKKESASRYRRDDGDEDDAFAAAAAAAEKESGGGGNRDGGSSSDGGGGVVQRKKRKKARTIF